jgi:hypothetical protein
MADNIIKVNVTSVKKQRVSVSNSQVGTEITASGDTGRFWAQTAKNWAVADVIVDNTDYSSKHYAEQSKASAQVASNVKTETQGLVDGFDNKVQIAKDDIETDKTSAIKSITTAKNSAISDIDTTGKSYDNLTHKNITNCLLEVPQNINYTLSNGTLTIKAGSKVIVPNGANKFDEITVSKDVSCSIANSDKNMLFIRNGNAYIARRLSSQTGSGTTNPTTGYYGFYNTTNNIVYDIRDGVTQNLGLLSLPVLIFTSDDKGVVSVDKVFNGFGYIGSTLFCDKGIKVLIPNGKNADGSLKNIEYTTPKVITGTLKDARSNTNFCLHNNGTLALRTNLKYNENSNYNYMDAVGNIYGMPFAIGTTTTNGVITEYKSLTNAVCLADANKTVSKLGDTMTGTLTSEANNGAEIHLKGDETNNWLTIKGTSSKYDYNDYENVPTENQRNLRLISYDKNGVFYFYQQVSAEKERNICMFNVKRKLTNGTEKNCSLGLRVQDSGTNTLLINGQPLTDFVISETKSGVTKTRTWSSGFKECWFQGIIGTNSVPTTLEMPITFSNKQYYVNGNYGNGFEITLEKGWVVYPITVVPYSASSIMVKSSGSIADIVCRFYACGY